MLRPGDRVFIDATGEEGIVSEVHTNDVLVAVRIESGFIVRTYPHEHLRFSPATRSSPAAFAV